MSIGLRALVQGCRHIGHIGRVYYFFFFSWAQIKQNKVFSNENQGRDYQNRKFNDAKGHGLLCLGV